MYSYIFSFYVHSLVNINYDIMLLELINIS